MYKADENFSVMKREERVHESRLIDTFVYCHGFAPNSDPQKEKSALLSPLAPVRGSKQLTSGARRWIHK